MKKIINGKDFLKLVVAIAVSQTAGLVGSIFTSQAINTWYNNLIRPTFAPPNWVFAPVWTTLFTLMGIAAFLVWQKGLSRPEVRSALKIFFFQLGLNILWSIFFFALRSPSAAFVEIISLWLAILATIISFGKISKTAAYLLIPYIAWVSFAAYLNYFILTNN